MARPHAPELSSSVLAVPPKGVILYGIGALCLHYWLERVCNIIPEPYLDEVFHIPQAQAYWAGSWRTWDPKITTPPGLYIYSYIFGKVFSFWGEHELSVRQLRISVEVLLMSLPIILLRCHPRYHNYQQWSSTLLLQMMHANLNIMLCPLLFFFSALYYTDVLSAFVVLEVYRWYIYSESDKELSIYTPWKFSPGTRSTICKTSIFLLGLFALLCRQTNIFWVAVFLGGLQVVRTLVACTHPSSATATLKGPVSGNPNMVLDPYVQDAAIEGTHKALTYLPSI